MKKIDQLGEEQISKLSSCPVCHPKKTDSLNDVDVECPRCGKFKVSGECNKSYERRLEKNERERFLVSHYIRSHGLKLLDRATAGYILEHYRFPRPQKQIDNTILFLGDETKFFGNGYYDFSPVRNLSSVIGVADKANYDRIFEELIKQELVKRLRVDQWAWHIELTMKGWDHYEKICSTESTKVFMAMQFERTDETREGTNFLYELHDPLQKLLDEIGYELITIKDVHHCGEITKRIETEIRSSAFVIVDLSHGNQGAYWEAGFAHGIGKKVIYICRQNERDNKKIHFDTDHYNTYSWNDSGDNNGFLSSLKSVIEAEIPKKITRHCASRNATLFFKEG